MGTAEVQFLAASPEKDSQSKHGRAPARQCGQYGAGGTADRCPLAPVKGAFLPFPNGLPAFLASADNSWRTSPRAEPTERSQASVSRSASLQGESQLTSQLILIIANYGGFKGLMQRKAKHTRTNPFSPTSAL